MKERNLCNEAGCSASCCRDSYFSASYPESKVLGWFPEAKKVSKHDLNERLPQGVYYSKGLYGNSRVRIVGVCPNLGEDNNCQIYEDRPADCANLEIDSKACSDFRSRDEQNRSDLIPLEDIHISPEVDHDVI